MILWATWLFIRIKKNIFEGYRPLIFKPPVALADVFVPSLPGGVGEGLCVLIVKSCSVELGRIRLQVQSHRCHWGGPSALSVDVIGFLVCLSSR